MEAYHPSMFGCSTSSSSSPSSYLTLMNTMMNNNNNNTTNMENNGLLKMSEDMMKSNELKNGFVGDGTESEARPGKNKKEDDDQQKKKKKKIKKGRFAFQTRSQVDILDDGYRWRKYGQKAVKNNRFPRSYYRCTYQGCNVKKQVQRLSKDEGVVVTTYEGVHSHPIEKSTENFENILTQMQIYAAF